MFIFYSSNYKECVSGLFFSFSSDCQDFLWFFSFLLPSIIYDPVLVILKRVCPLLGAEDFTREENLPGSDASLKADYVETL